jgi:hypothetical protein
MEVPFGTQLIPLDRSLSTNSPTASAHESSPSGKLGAFLTKLSGGGTGLTYSTYLGGNNSSTGYGRGLRQGP